MFGNKTGRSLYLRNSDLFRDRTYCRLMDGESKRLLWAKLGNDLMLIYDYSCLSNTNTERQSKQKCKTLNQKKKENQKLEFVLSVIKFISCEMTTVEKQVYTKQ